MRFMVIRRADKQTEAGVLPSKALLDAMTQYHMDGAKAGIVIDGTGLQPSSKGARVAFAGGKVTVTDGPFAVLRRAAECERVTNHEGQDRSGF